ncbi:hypothetical protein PhCBS80983_g03428 [Powellomyces hirtus]|uniref:Nop14-like protein n=1 Tax=Powellomyces hirtus TaxID=109895 RepID=A0A507E4J2_9FUNG|nr:hypothetical protein PhCBS80983_g03428 [Powellomyces hirtus]
MGKPDPTTATTTGHPSKGGSALKRLKASLKSAGVIGKHQKISKKKSTTQRAAALGERKEAREILRGLSTKARDTNPFETKINRQKHDVLNRKIKGATGKPGVVRKRGEENRTRTLAVEMDRRNKDSAFVDRRFGERDATMSLEDKMLERFMKEKSKRAADRGSMFNLEDDDEDMMELTHMGQSLNAFSDAGLQKVHADPADDSDSGQIDKDTVRYTHFGGFSEDDEAAADPNDDGTGKRKSKNEVMKEVIAKSKLHKRERQMLKEQDEDLAEELDAQLDDIKALLATNKPAAPYKAFDALTGATDTNTIPVSNKRGHDAAAAGQAANDNRRRGQDEDGDEEDYDDYDRFVRELATERRAKPTDRLKTEQELAAAEKLRLEQLEKDRQRRMMGLPTEKEEAAAKMQAKLDAAASANKRPAEADDLGDDDYTAAVETMVRDEEEVPLLYRDGRLLNKEVFMRKRRKVDGDDDEEQDEDEDEEDGTEDEDDDEEEDDDDEEEDESDADENDWAIEDVNDTLGEEAGSDDNNNDKEHVSITTTTTTASSSKPHFVPTKQRTVDETAAKELPYTFTAPDTHDDFLALVGDRTPEEQATIVQRLRALHHVKLGGDNRKKLEKLLEILLTHLTHLSNTPTTPTTLPTINALSAPTIELSQQFPTQAATHFLTLTTALQKKLSRDLASTAPHRRASALPHLDALVAFRLVGRIFSTSDLKHEVVTPVMLLMSQYLSQAPVADWRGALSGLFVCEMLAEYQALSKRFIPEAVNFLATVLALILPTSSSCEPTTETDTNIATETDIASIETAPILDPAVTCLRIRDWETATAKPSSSPPVSLLHTLAKLNTTTTTTTPPTPPSEPAKLALLTTTLTLLTRYMRLYMDSPTFPTLFAAIPHLLTHIPPTLSFPALTTTHTLLTALTHSTTLKRRPLVLQKFKPTPLATHVPKFDTHYSVDRKAQARDPDRARATAAKLKFEYKKELKGAVRELRKDASFVNRKRTATLKQADAAYKSKMDKILGGLANQEGAMRGYERELKKAKGKKR